MKMQITPKCAALFSSGFQRSTSSTVVNPCQSSEARTMQSHKVTFACVGLLLVTLVCVRASNSKLSHVWVNRRLRSDLAKKINDHQSKCSEKVFYHPMLDYGMGSDIHIWSQALCNSMQTGSTLMQADMPWIWNDKQFCASNNTVQPFGCYFSIQKHCPTSVPHHTKVISYENDFKNCPTYVTDIKSRQAFRAAAMEYLFSNLHPGLVELAEKSIQEVFGQPTVPSELITVHVRWGDKKREMDLVHQHDYVTSIEKMVEAQTLTSPHIYVTTESMDALVKLQDELDSHNKTSWKLHYYAPAVFNSTAEGVVSPMDMATHSGGIIGKTSLVALLLAMEAKYYVLTTGSNWSRLIDELRKAVVDVSCGGCTHMVDLRQAFAAQDW
jgi:hypothetical protein